LLTHPTLDQLNQLGLHGMAQAFAELEACGDTAPLSHTDWRGLLLDREVTYRHDKRWQPACAMPGCASMPSLRTSIIACRAVSSALCSKSSPAANGSTRTTI
jgi:hypothetical protein